MPLSIIPDPIDESKKRLREDRFKDHLGDHSNNNNDDQDDDSGDSTRSPKRIKGLNNKLEKSYFRLTSEAKASQVRPLKVLKKSLEHVKKKYIDEENYSYCCDQVSS